MKREYLKKSEPNTTILKSLFGAVPYVGTALNEVLFERRSRLKQERLNNFIIEFSKFLGKYSPTDISHDFINSDAFSDIFESILRRVTNTNSNTKIDRFKRVLAQQIINYEPFEYTETFLDLIERLNEKQIMILIGHCNFNYDLNDIEESLIALKESKEKDTMRLKQETEWHKKGKANDYLKVSKNIEVISKRIEELKTLKYKDIKFRKPEHYSLLQAEYNFCVQDLVSKGLLIDSGLTWNKAPLQFLSITAFGKTFLKFIDEYKTDQ